MLSLTFRPHGGGIRKFTIFLLIIFIIFLSNILGRGRERRYVSEFCSIMIFFYNVKRWRSSYTIQLTLFVSEMETVSVNRCVWSVRPLKRISGPSCQPWTRSGQVAWWHITCFWWSSSWNAWLWLRPLSPPVPLLQRPMKEKGHTPQWAFRSR